MMPKNRLPKRLMLSWIREPRVARGSIRIQRGVHPLYPFCLFVCASYFKLYFLLTALRAGPPFSWGVTSGGPPGGRSLSKDGTRALVSRIKKAVDTATPLVELKFVIKALPSSKTPCTARATR